MFTVLIAEKEHIDAIQQDNKLFFEPFLESKEVAFCTWNPEGQNLLDSVPGLPEVVGRRKNWRAVILNSITADSVKLRNPFDVVEFSAVTNIIPPKSQPEIDQRIDDWEKDWVDYYDKVTAEKETVYRKALSYPLQKLTTWLCFKQEDYVLNDVREKQDVHDWAMEEISKDELKPSVKMELFERDQYKRELRLKETIRREFLGESRLNIAYPAEVLCISIRTAENSFFDPDDYWNVRSINEYSQFSDRNMYFDKMRFMVFDLLPRTHRDFRTDYIRFLATVMIFISNPIPGSAMQARRLYTLETETDDAPLCTMVTSFDRKLAATAEVIESEMERIRGEIPGELKDKDAEALFCTPKDIPVLLDESCEPDKVLADKEYGLFFDSPTNELYKWNGDYQNAQKSFGYIVKQRSRAVRKSVNQAQLSYENTNVDVSRLTPLQIDDIREYTDRMEDEMIASIPPDFSKASVYTERMEKASEDVRKVIRRRMTQKTTIALMAICAGLLLLCFLPFLFSNNGTTKTISTALLLSGCMVGLLVVILIIALFFMRFSVVKAVGDYNNTSRDILSSIQSSLGNFAKYLSAFYMVRRGHAIQNCAQKDLDEYTKSLRIRKKHQDDIRKRRAYLVEKYGDYLGDRSFCDETMSRPYEYDFDQQVEYAYPAPFLAGDCRQIEFISSGNMVTVPSSFVTRILVKMEGIYE